MFHHEIKGTQFKVCKVSRQSGLITLQFMAETRNFWLPGLIFQHCWWVSYFKPTACLLRISSAFFLCARQHLARERLVSHFRTLLLLTVARRIRSWELSERSNPEEGGRGLGLRRRGHCVWVQPTHILQGSALSSQPYRPVWGALCVSLHCLLASWIGPSLQWGLCARKKIDETGEEGHY